MRQFSKLKLKVESSKKTWRRKNEEESIYLFDFFLKSICSGGTFKFIKALYCTVVVYTMMGEARRHDFFKEGKLSCRNEDVYLKKTANFWTTF